MKYTIRIGFAVLCAGLITYVAFNLIERLLRVGTGQMAWARVVSLTGPPEVVYLESLPGEHYQVTLDDSTIVIVDNPAIPLQAEFSAGRNNVVFNGTMAQPGFSRAYLFEKPGTVTFSGVRRGGQGIVVRFVSAKGGIGGRWRWAGRHGKYFLQVSDWLERSRAHGGTQVPAKLEATGIHVQAGDYVFFNGDDRPHAGAENFQFGYSDANGRVRYYDNKRYNFNEGLYDQYAWLLPGGVTKGYRMPIDCELWVAYIRSGSSNSRTARLMVNVVREVQ